MSTLAIYAVAHTVNWNVILDLYILLKSALKMQEMPFQIPKKRLLRDLLSGIFGQQTNRVTKGARVSGAFEYIELTETNQ